MDRRLTLATALLLGCGARSALEPDDGEQAVGGSSGIGAGDVGGFGGQPAGAGGNGGEGPQGGEGPLCVPVACTSSWETALDAQWLPGWQQEIATDPCGNVVVTSMDSEEGVWAAQLDASGALKWSRKLAAFQWDDADNRAALVAGTPSGDVVVALSYDIGFYIDGVSVSNAEEVDIALLRLDSEGNLEWVKAFSTNENEYPTALAVTPDGDILLGGKTQGGVDFGGGPLESGLFLARFSASGEHEWSYRFADSGNGPRAIASTPGGEIWLLGRARHDVQFPGGQLLEGNSFSDRVLVARLAADGGALFTAAYGTGSDLFFSPRGLDISARESGVRFVTALRGGVDFGAGEVQLGEGLATLGLADVELAPDGTLVSASQLLIPVTGVQTAIGPSSVFVGMYGELVEVGDAGPMTLASFAEPDAPLVTRMPDGLISLHRGDPAIAGSVVSRRCDP